MPEMLFAVMAPLAGDDARAPVYQKTSASLKVDPVSVTFRTCFDASAAILKKQTCDVSAVQSSHERSPSIGLPVERKALIIETRSQAPRPGTFCSRRGIPRMQFFYVSTVVKVNIFCIYFGVIFSVSSSRITIYSLDGKLVIHLSG